jgi:hypothetical protein
MATAIDSDFPWTECQLLGWCSGLILKYKSPRLIRGDWHFPARTRGRCIFRGDASDRE